MAKVRNSGVQEKVLRKYMYVGELHVFTFTLTTVSIPGPFVHLRNIKKQKFQYSMVFYIFKEKPEHSLGIHRYYFLEISFKPALRRPPPPH